MAKSLIIVESPTKAKTLARYLDNDYVVKASVGHIKDLPKSRLGIDLEHDFEPQYTTIRGKGKVIDEIKKACTTVDTVYLAPDPDREGEAIAWHLAEDIKKKNPNIFRILFHEITKKGVLEALEHPSELNQPKFESQLARRILDRLVGYQLSPLLWKKVKSGLSAGRVQSVAVRLVVEREREIQRFIPVEYWTVEAKVVTDAGVPISMALWRIDGKKASIPDGAMAAQVVEELKAGAPYTLTKVERKQVKKHAPPPYITSKLQQDAARFYKFPARKTMQVAQQLYEGIDLGGEVGQVGLITYMRTDSTRLSQESIDAARGFISGRYGEQYVPAKPATFKNKKSAQDAHEAIRPTDPFRTPDSLAKQLTPDQLKIYGIIWRRFVACQMRPALFDQTTVLVDVGRHVLRTVGSILTFDGFKAVYKDRQNASQDDEGPSKQLPDLHEGDTLQMQDIIPTQNFTEPKPRYTESTLIKELEELGIGRPSTYATIIGTITSKEYVIREKGRFRPSELGYVVTDLLVDSFPKILDATFTANMEEALDSIEEGSREWIDLVKPFWDEFSKTLEHATEHMRNVKTQALETDVVCEKCGAPMVIKFGKAGSFLGCSSYPDCTFTMEFSRDEKGAIVAVREEPVDSGEVCPSCGKPMVVKRGKYGEFLACIDYPTCKTTQPISTKVACPREGCDGTLIKKTTRRGKVFYGCNKYPACDFASWDEPIPKECPSCDNYFLFRKQRKAGVTLQCMVCKHTEPEGDDAS